MLLCPRIGRTAPPENLYQRLIQDLPEASFFPESPEEGRLEAPVFVGEWSNRIGVPRTVVQVRV